MTCRFPDYENCGLNVVSAIARYFGAQNRHRPHGELWELLCRKQYRNVVLFLCDGMGMDALRRNSPPDSFLNTHVWREISSVYPSTTVAATTSIETDYAPAEHGWLGWTMYFTEIGKAVDVFLNTDAGEKTQAADYPVAKTYLPLQHVFDRINACGQARAAEISAFGEPRYPTLEDIREALVMGCREEGRHFFYGYWNDPDHTMHETGVYSDEVRQAIAGLDAYLEDLAAALTDDTLLLVTADHGLVDAEHLYVTDHPELAAALVRPTMVEARTTVFYVREEMRDSFPRLFAQAFPEGFALMTGEEFLRSGILGPGEQNPKLPQLTGDYVAIALTEKCIDYAPKENPLCGVHAGLTSRETRVPLIVAKG